MGNRKISKKRRTIEKLLECYDELHPPLADQAPRKRQASVSLAGLSNEFSLHLDVEDLDPHQQYSV